MNGCRLIGVLLLIVSFLTPDVALTMQNGRPQNACGTMVCCCPQMCKRAKKKLLSCRRNERESCGVKAGLASSLSYSNDSIISRVGNSTCFSLPIPPVEFRVTLEEHLTLTPEQSSRLEKPP